MKPKLLGMVVMVLCLGFISHFLARRLTSLYAQKTTLGHNKSASCTQIEEAIPFSNKLIALSNRLIANYHKAQDWEAIDPDHPTAVAIRSKIAEEELEFKIEIHKRPIGTTLSWAKPSDEDWESCGDKILQYTDTANEYSAVQAEWTNQLQRYHALGYPK